MLMTVIADDGSIGVTILFSLLLYTFEIFHYKELKRGSIDVSGDIEVRCFQCSFFWLCFCDFSL